MVGQGAERLSLERPARRLANEARGGSLLMASTLLAPATLMVALGLLLPILILLRYSFNKFDPRLMMVEAVTLENYVKFFTDPFYTNVFWTTLRVSCVRSSASCWRFRWLTYLRAARAATKTWY